MTAAVLGITMLVASSAVSPSVATPRGTLVPAGFTVTLPDGPAMPRHASGYSFTEPSRPAWTRPSRATMRATSSNRFSTTDQIIAVAAGLSVGFTAGGTIGARLTDNPDNPDDDTSVLKGIVIGAPVGAIIGGLIGYRLTR